MVATQQIRPSPVASANRVARLRGISHSYGKPPHTVQVLHDIDLDIRAGEVMLLTGHSGSGKTTLLTILGLLLRPTRGVVEIGGEPLAGANERMLTRQRLLNVSFIFQNFNLLSALTARENVQVGLGLQRVRGRDAEIGALELLDRVGLRERASHRPAQLSCGQQQRVAIARALASPAMLLLADEPTGNLDGTSALQVIEMLRRLAVEHRRAIVIVTHDSRLLSYAHRVVQLEDGRILSDTAEEKT
jgi:putative ABC transport system ATP-binding protein